jgi:hypothetical protein
LLAAISLFAPCFFGLGLLALLPLPRFWAEPAADPAQRATALAAALALGMTVYYGLMLAIERPEVTAAVSLGLAAIGWSATLIRARRELLRSLALGRWAYGLLILLLIAAALHILLRPLADSDARTIWFHHAKVIYFFGDFDPFASWGTDRRQFFHLDYPKLLATLASSAATLAGFWNEYFPKLALVALLLPPLVATLGFLRQPLTLILVLVAFYCLPRAYMWNGFMDGYLALYAGFMAIHFGRWLGERRLVDLVAGIAFLAVTVGLKNEGYMLLVAFAGAGLFAAFRSRDGVGGLVKAFPLPALVPALLAFSGFFLWLYLRRQWHLENDLEFGPGAWARAMERLGDPEALALLGESLFLTAATALPAGMVAAMFWQFRRWPESRPAGTDFALALALLYFGGVILIYLMTPHTLTWHLGTSAERVLMTPRALAFAAIALWLQEREIAGRIRLAPGAARRISGA